MHELKKCHYCGETAYGSETECRSCGALLNGAKPGRLFLGVLWAIGALFVFFLFWVAYKLFLRS